ncbi:flagellar biosynthetic protein FliO [Candidatus Sodalis endolongispinus]|uniref:Flagellar protein n=1 Tax=Candidatus Sodalis endolongispinus TaxID=2812662 RepID=A0ABS5Y8F2_9GAMM|nr:flagellar biosynthetic protein FliO [Candidatus Sodalis endolongispinus]MBT9431212.1 flagellar biosynthetic protein FliO [Candidatus Sodalis endolongispinus]
MLLIIIGGWLLKTLRLTPAGRSGNRLAIRASCSVGPREKVLIMQVDDTWLVLGVTPQHITTLHSLPAPAQTEHDACGPAPAQTEHDACGPAPEDFRQRLLRLSRQRSGNA